MRNRAGQSIAAKERESIQHVDRRIIEVVWAAFSQAGFFSAMSACKVEPEGMPPLGMPLLEELLGYGLRELPAHLESMGERDRLYCLARCEPFLEAQAKEGQSQALTGNPSTPLFTVQIALQGAIKQDKAAEMAAFTLGYTRWSRRTTNESPLDALRAGNLERARDLADLYDIERTVLWYLLLVWKLSDGGDLDDARKTARFLRDNKSLPELQSFRVQERAADLLQYMLEIDEDAFAELHRRLLNDEGYAALCQHLIESGHLDEAISMARVIRNEWQKVETLVSIVSVQVASREHDSAQLTITVALDVVSLITDNETRAWALSKVAAAQAQIGKIHLARSILAIALEAARGTGDKADSSSRQEALAAIAIAQARVGEFDAALEMLDRVGESSLEYPQTVHTIATSQAAAHQFAAAFQTAQRLKPQKRTRTLTAIAGEQAKAGLTEEARQTVQAIEHPGWRARALLAVAEAGDAAGTGAALDAAIEAARDIDDNKEKVLVLSKIGMAQVRAGDMEGARATFEAMHRSAKGFDDEDGRRLLTAIAVEQAEAGARDMARDTFAAARKTLPDSTKLDWLTRSRWEIGVAQAEAGEREMARTTFAGALQLPSEWEGEWLRPWALADIARAQAKAAEIDAARKTVTLALQTMEPIEGEWRSIAQLAIAGAQAEMGDYPAALRTAQEIVDGEGWKVMVAVAAKEAEAGDWQAASESFAAALEAAQEAAREGPSSSYDDALVEIAVAKARAGNFEAALQTAHNARVLMIIAETQAEAGDFATALRTAHDICGWSERHEAIRKIASAQAAKGEREVARETFATVVEAAKEIGDRNLAAATLIETATAQAQAGEVEAARRTFAEALGIVSEIKADWKRTEMLVSIAKARAATGDVPAARRTADAIEHPWFQGEALIMVVANQLKENDWYAVSRTVERIESPWWRAMALVGMAVRRSLQGENVEAQQCMTAAQELMQEIPEGEARDRLLEGIVESLEEIPEGEAHDRLLGTIVEFLEVNSGEQAEQRAEGIVTERNVRLVTERNVRLPKVAAALASAGDLTNFKRLLLPCASYQDAAYRMCSLLAHAYPKQAAAVAEEVARARTYTLVPAIPEPRQAQPEADPKDFRMQD